jgi:hypothetical protein
MECDRIVAEMANRVWLTNGKENRIQSLPVVPILLFQSLP